MADALVTFQRHHDGHNPGEQAGMPLDQAQRLASAGVVLIHGEPLKLTDEQRAALPPLPALDPTADVNYVAGVSTAEIPPPADYRPDAGGADDTGAPGEPLFSGGTGHLMDPVYPDADGVAMLAGDGTGEDLPPIE